MHLGEMDKPTGTISASLSAQCGPQSPGTGWRGRHRPQARPPHPSRAPGRASVHGGSPQELSRIPLPRLARPHRCLEGGPPLGPPTLLQSLPRASLALDRARVLATKEGSRCEPAESLTLPASG